MKLGVAAVYVFFVLSGYWVSSMWANRYSKCNYAYFVFMVSRYWRLLPLFIVCYIIAACIVFFAPGLWRFDAHQIYSLGWWLRSCLLLYTGQAYLFAQVWSLAKEMEFYFLAPFLMPGGFLSGFFGDRRWTGFLLFAIPVLFCLWMFGGIKSGLHFCFFLVGVLAFALKWQPSRRFACLSLSALVGAIVFCYFSPCFHSFVFQETAFNGNDNDGSQFFFLVSAIEALVFLPFAIHTVHQSTAKSDRFIGDLAYPVYLFHWIPVSINSIFISYPFPLQVFTILATSIVCSLILKILIDGPSERARHKFVKSWQKQSPVLVSECLRET